MTRPLLGILVLLLVLGSAVAGAVAGAAPAATAFETLKPLVGTWRAASPDGSEMTLTYRLVSSGTALMEEMSYEGMITVYHPDGDAVMLTHYCAGNNQPRLRAEGVDKDGRTIRFVFQDITNLGKPEDEYMSDLTVTLVDADHFRQDWTSTTAGKHSVMTVTWTRVK